MALTCTRVWCGVQAKAAHLLVVDPEDIYGCHCEPTALHAFELLAPCGSGDPCEVDLTRHGHRASVEQQRAAVCTHHVARRGRRHRHVKVKREPRRCGQAFAAQGTAVPVPATTWGGSACNGITVSVTMINETSSLNRLHCMGSLTLSNRPDVGHPATACSKAFWIACGVDAQAPGQAPGGRSACPAHARAAASARPNAPSRSMSGQTDVAYELSATSQRRARWTSTRGGSWWLRPWLQQPRGWRAERRRVPPQHRVSHPHIQGQLPWCSSTATRWMAGSSYVRDSYIRISSTLMKISVLEVYPLLSQG